MNNERYVKKYTIKKGENMDKKRALISVWDKSNIVKFAKELIKLDYEIISTGGTFEILKRIILMWLK